MTIWAIFLIIMYAVFEIVITFEILDRATTEDFDTFMDIYLMPGWLHDEGDLNWFGACVIWLFLFALFPFVYIFYLLWFAFTYRRGE